MVITGMVLVGTIRCDLTNVDMSKFQSRNVRGRVEYKLDFQVGVDFRADEGILHCFSQAQGRTIGVTTISFADLVG